MKKGLNYSMYMFNTPGQSVPGSKKILAVSVFFFLTGIFTGLFLELTMDSGEKNSLTEYLQQYLYMDSGAVQYPNPFFSSLCSNLLLLLIIFLAGLSVFGIPAAMAALSYKGMSLGFCTGLIAESLKDKGILVILTALLPQNLLLIPAFVLASSAALCYALGFLRRNRQAAKRSPRNSSGSYLLFMIVLALVILLACGLEAILYPVVL